MSEPMSIRSSKLSKVQERLLDICKYALEHDGQVPTSYARRWESPNEQGVGRRLGKHAIRTMKRLGLITTPPFSPYYGVDLVKLRDLMVIVTPEEYSKVPKYDRSQSYDYDGYITNYRRVLAERALRENEPEAMTLLDEILEDLL